MRFPAADDHVSPAADSCDLRRCDESDPITVPQALARPPRSVTMSVAPNCRARSCREACRDMAMIRSAPISFAAITPHRPTAPSPTTTAVEPGGIVNYEIGYADGRRDKLHLVDQFVPFTALRKRE